LRFRLALSGTQQEFDWHAEMAWVSLSNAITVRFFTVRLDHFGSKATEVILNSRLGVTIVFIVASTSLHIVT